MAINFNQQEKSSKVPLRKFLWVFLLVIAIGFAAWKFLIKGQQTKELQSPTAATETFKKIDINFNILSNPVFAGLQEFQKVPEFDGKIGKVNPFK